MIQPPRHITFTGVDAYTDIGQMVRLSREYPVEWGVLMSPTRSGDDTQLRYPSWKVISDLVRAVPARMHLAAHLCGGYVTELLATGSIRGVDAVLGRYFGRVQVNVPEDRRSDAVTSNLVAWSKRVGVRLILQTADERLFPGSFNKDVQWLFDRSGGRGIDTVRYPVAERGRDPVGFAGGLHKGNVREKVAVFGGNADLYWIDMESGVRDAHDMLDLAACRAVCEEVYGRSLFESTSALDLGEQSMRGSK